MMSGLGPLARIGVGDRAFGGGTGSLVLLREAALSGPVACSRGLEAAGGQTLRSILRAVLATAQRGMRNEGGSVEGFRVRACLAGTLKGPPSSSHIVLCLASNCQVIAWFPFQYPLLVRRTGFSAFFIEVLKLFPKLSRSCLSQGFPIF